MAYEAPDIKDRVAIGDNQFIMSDAGGGKILLTPAPDEVVEAGTDINKALLQPLCDAVEKIDTETVPAVNKLLPYNLYYWLSRGISGYYSEVQTLAWNSAGTSESIVGFGKRTDVIYLFKQSNNGDVNSCTVQYSSSVKISQTNGSVSLVSPRTATFEYSYASGSAVRDEIDKTLTGKFVSGLRPGTGKIFYLPIGSAVDYVTSSEKDYTGYSWTTTTVGGSSSYGDNIMLVSSKYNSTNTPWGYISSTEPDTYPTSGTVDGTEYIKLGRIDEAFLNYAVKNPTAFQNIATFEARLSALESAISGISRL